MGLIKILILKLKTMILIKIKHNQWCENPRKRKRKMQMNSQCEHGDLTKWWELKFQFNTVFEIVVQVEKPK